MNLYEPEVYLNWSEVIFAETKINRQYCSKYLRILPSVIPFTITKAKLYIEYKKLYIRVAEQLKT